MGRRKKQTEEYKVIIHDREKIAKKLSLVVRRWVKGY